MAYIPVLFINYKENINALYSNVTGNLSFCFGSKYTKEMYPFCQLSLFRLGK